MAGETEGTEKDPCVELVCDLRVLRGLFENGFTTEDAWQRWSRNLIEARGFKALADKGHLAAVTR